MKKDQIENLRAARLMSVALKLPTVLTMSVGLIACSSAGNPAGGGTGDDAGTTGQTAFGASDDGGGATATDGSPAAYAEGSSPQTGNNDAGPGLEGGMVNAPVGTSPTGTTPTGTTQVHDASTATGTGGVPSGWLYTKGNHIYQSGSDSTPWVGRGVNMDDVFFCGYDNSLWMNSPGQTVQTIVSGLLSGWKPTFLRMSLSMDSYGTAVSWLSNPSQYKDPMTSVIQSVTSHPGVYVLVTLRSDASMIGHFTAADPEATGLPSDSTTTPDATKFPTGTDATYVALVDSFAHDGNVLFGLTNEPGGNSLSNATIKAAMNHAVGVIRAEEDRLGVPHHIVSVQGNGWTSDISFYAASPLTYDNVVYEVHGYPPPAASYTYSNIPVILGEYGSLSDSSSFYADLESKKIPSLAWDFDPYNNCAPDLVNVTTSATNLTPTSWGSTVQGYLTSH